MRVTTEDRDLAKSYDVIVLGAGMVGAAIARELVAAGLSVHIIDRTDPGLGSTGRCDGNVLVQTKHSANAVSLTLHSIEGFRRWERELGNAMRFEQPGSLVFFADETQSTTGTRRAEWLAENGARVEVLDERQVREKEPALDGPVTGGLDCADDASVYPPFAVRSLLSNAISHGARLTTGVTAMEVVVDGAGRTKGVLTSEGTFHAPWVVNAMGLWAGSLRAPTLHPVPIRPRQGVLLVTGEARGLFRRAVTEAAYMTLRAGGSQDSNEKPVFVAEPTFRGNLLIGSSRRFLGEDVSVDQQLVRDIMARAVHFSSHLARVPIIRSFAGLRPWTPDNRPIIGETPDLPGYILATGHEGEGIGLAPATAEMVAGLITGQELPSLLRESLLDFTPARFTGTDADRKVAV